MGNIPHKALFAGAICREWFAYVSAWFSRSGAASQVESLRHLCLGRHWQCARERGVEYWYGATCHVCFAAAMKKVNRHDC